MAGAFLPPAWVLPDNPPSEAGRTSQECEQDRLHLEDCPAAPKLVAETLPPSISAASAPPPDLSELASRDKPPDDRQSQQPTIDLLAATAGGAPNVVTLRIARVEVQTLKELDDNYVGMNLGLAQNLIYGRGQHKVSGIVVQLNRTEDLERARARLLALFKEHGLDLEVRDFTELNPQYNQIIGLFRAIFSFISTIIAFGFFFPLPILLGLGG